MKDLIKSISKLIVDSLTEDIPTSISLTEEIIKDASAKKVIPEVGVNIMYISGVAYDPRLYINYIRFLRNTNPEDIHISLRGLTPEAEEFLWDLKGKLDKNAIQQWATIKILQRTNQDPMEIKIDCDHTIGYHKFLDVLYGYIQDKVSNDILRLKSKFS